MKNPIETHTAAIKAGEVTKTNVIGVRKILNTYSRIHQGWSVSRTAPKVTGSDVARLEHLLADKEPLVTGDLHDSGVVLLQGKRYRRQLERVSEIVGDLAQFRLVGFDYIGRHGEYAVPVYRAIAANGKSFIFRNIPWQSGGRGPEIMRNWPNA